MSNKKGWDQAIMLSLFKKETAYNTAVTPINATNFFSMQGFADFAPDFDDKLADDAAEVSGSEVPTMQEIMEYGAKFTYTEPKARPSSVIGFMGLVMGSLTSTKDGAFNAWKHKGNIVALGSTLASINAIGKKGGVQKLLTGIMCNSVELKSEEGGPISLTAELVCSGTRATDATGFVAKLTEPRMYAKSSKVWLESGAAISIDATLTQGLENISTGAGTVLGARMKSWRVKYINNLVGNPGFGGAGSLQDLDYVRRAMELAFTLRFNDVTEMDFYENQTALALELDCKLPTLIAAGGSMYWGFNSIIPKFQLKKCPLPKGGVGDILTADYETIILNDGTNAPMIFEGYSAQTAYLA